MMQPFSLLHHFPLNLSGAAIPNMNILLLEGFFSASNIHFSPILNIMYLQGMRGGSETCS